MNARLLLAAFALLALASLVAVSWWASSVIDIRFTLFDLWQHPDGGNNPWLIATLFDAYFGFLWFWLWVAYREPSWMPRLLWLALFLALGNIAMAGYVLLALYRLPTGAPVSNLLALRRT